MLMEIHHHHLNIRRHLRRSSGDSDPEAQGPAGINGSFELIFRLPECVDETLDPSCVGCEDIYGLP